jgi:glycosyltransferase involved in cell wall biosynthesis
MKIAHIFWSFTVGGAETMLVDIMNQQVESKNNVTLIVINKNYSTQLLSSLDHRVEVVFLNRRVSSKNPLPFIRLNLLLLRKSYSVIHCHNYNLENVIIANLLKKTIVTIHGFNRPINVKNKYFKVVAISEAIENDLKDKGLINIKTIYNGIDCEKIEKKRCFNPDLKVVCIGRLDHKIKGQDILLNAIRILKKENLNIKLYFIGNGSSKVYLMNLVSKLKLMDDVVFYENKPRSELYKVIKDFDVLVQPSIHEGFGLTVVEAMTACIPVVVSEAAGLMEVTCGGRYAEVIRPNTPEKIAEIIMELNEKIHTNIFHARLREGSEYVCNNFSIKNTCDNYYDLYRQCME